MSTLPAPLTPPECNLRDFGFMPWEITRFRQSDLLEESAEAIVAAMLLYGESWHSVPAASLPNDDVKLAKAAGYGRSVAAWLEVKKGALRGFIECSDGRLYHPVVAENANRAWQSKLAQRHRTFMAAVRKHNERNPNDRRASPTFEQWLALGRPDRVTNESAAPAPQQGDLELPAIEPERPHETDEKAEKSRVTAEKVTRDTPPKSRVLDHPRESKGIGKGDSIESEDSPLTPLSEITAELATLAGVSLAKEKTRTEAEAQVTAWLDEGIAVDTLKAAIGKGVARLKSPSYSLKRFAADVRHETAKAATKPKRQAEPNGLGPDDDDPRVADFRAALREHMKPREYGDWLKATRMSLNGSGIVITFPNAFRCDWTEQHLSRIIAAEAARLDLGNVKLTVA